MLINVELFPNAQTLGSIIRIAVAIASTGLLVHQLILATESSVYGVVMATGHFPLDQQILVD